MVRDGSDLYDRVVNDVIKSKNNVSKSKILLVTINTLPRYVTDVHFYQLSRTYESHASFKYWYRRRQTKNSVKYETLLISS